MGIMDGLPSMPSIEVDGTREENGLQAVNSIIIRHT